MNRQNADPEATRLAALRRCGIFQTPAEQDFDFLTRLAAEICQVPYAFVTFVDQDYVWAKAWHGVEKIAPAARCDDYCDFVIRSGQPLVVHDLCSDPRTASLPPTLDGFRMYAGVPLLTADQQAIGTLCVLDKQAGHPSDHQVELLQSLARQVMALVELRQHKRELEDNVHLLERLATTDELTGLMNRRRLMERLGEECARARRFKEPMALVLLDLDHFKQVNDQWGHATGDIVLANTGRLIRETLRETDSAGRYGGEELCLLLPHTELDGAATVADTLCGRLATRSHRTAGAPEYVTASLGVAASSHLDQCHPATLLAQADAALYRAKDNGRNCVVVAQEALA